MIKLHIYGDQLKVHLDTSWYMVFVSFSMFKNLAPCKSIFTTTDSKKHFATILLLPLIIIILVLLLLTKIIFFLFLFFLQSLVWRMIWGRWKWEVSPATTSMLNVSLTAHFSCQPWLDPINLSKLYQGNLPMVNKHLQLMVKHPQNYLSFYMNVCEIPAAAKHASQSGGTSSDRLFWHIMAFWLSLFWSWSLLYTRMCCACPGVNPRVKSGRFMKLLPDYEHMHYRDVYAHCMYMGLRVDGCSMRGSVSGALIDFIWKLPVAECTHPGWTINELVSVITAVCLDIKCEMESGIIRCVCFWNGQECGPLTLDVQALTTLTRY